MFSPIRIVTPRTRVLVCFNPRSLLFQPRFRSSVHDGDPQTIGIEKQRNMEKKQHLTSTTHEEMAPGWNEYLASSSEANIKADKFGEEGPPTSELATKTLRHIGKRYGTNEGSREEANYERDEVQGPLRASTAGTFEEVYVKETLWMEEKEMTRSEEYVKSDRGEI